MTPEQIEEFINLARKVFTREVSFAEFSARLKFELQKLPEKEVQKNDG